MDHHHHQAVDAGTALAGGLAAIADGGASLFTLIGLAIGLTGALCGLSREYREWLDRRDARRGPPR
jgi:hypothetical protein